MADITCIRGDSKNITVTITDDATPTPAAIDISAATSILRFGVKAGNVPNASAVIFLTSYNSAEIEKTDPVNGECVVKLQSHHTRDQSSGPFCWDMELARAGVSVTTAGTIAVTAGDTVIAGTSLDLSNVYAGDILVPAGVAGANQIPLVITAVGGDGTALDPGAGNLRTDYSSWVTEAAISHEIFRGDIKTPVNLSGTFTITGDVVT